MTLWPTSDIDLHKKVINHPQQKMEWSSSQNLEQKMKMLDIDIAGSLAVDMGATVVKGGGSFNYLTDKRVKEN